MTDRPASPSCRSEGSGWSLEQPVNFKGEELLECRSKMVDRPDSPSCGSEISNWSKEQPPLFRETEPVDYKSSNRASSGGSFDSMKESSMSLPETEDKKSLQVSIATESGVGTMTTELSSDTPSIIPQEPRQNPRQAVPGDVVCDLCEGDKMKACKSCMTCLASFCEKHVIDHYTVEALRRHLLVEVSKNLEILQENALLKKTIKEERKENQRLKQIICKLRLPDYICKGKAPVAANVVLDPDTAHCSLLLSNNDKQVRVGDKTTVSQSSQRFDKWECVLAKEGFSSGRHFWEVKVNQKFTIGVTRQSAERKGKFIFGPGEGYWCLYHFRQAFTALDSPTKRLQADCVPQVLGVCMDVDEKWVTFYNTETKAHIYTFSNMLFSEGEKIYPVFNTMEKSASLVIRTEKIFTA